MSAQGKILVTKYGSHGYLPPHFCLVSLHSRVVLLEEDREFQSHFYLCKIKLLIIVNASTIVWVLYSNLIIYEKIVCPGEVTGFLLLDKDLGLGFYSICFCRTKESFSVHVITSNVESRR